MSGDGTEWVLEPLDDQEPDVSGANLFSEELANIDASEWDVDAAALWGDETDGPDPGAAPLCPDPFL
ncbi:MAG: hypothetical protein IR160_00730 [Salinibacterium sp.]|nr:hypothetical protein [Salinibacterium sp.]MBF0671092.1 hypothetical protein [Salinibacterium sp.]